MCGISGVVSRSRSVDPVADVTRMNNLVRHRGPDGEGVFYRQGFALGHRRLAIVDLSESGHQPMARGGRYWITYNGEIYNYLELREELQLLGETFQSGTDTEVILSAYARWGAECLHRFNGMWAFAIYDAQEERLFLARDRFGVKPLYYAETPSRFAFGSEIKQLLPFLPHVRANRKVVIEAMLTSIDGHSSATFFDGVLAFPQGHRAIYDLRSHRFIIEPWYVLRAARDAQDLREEDAVERFRTLFEDSVRIRMRADVQVGTCLSGGLDSSATSGTASRIYHKSSNSRFMAIHAKSIDAETDESHHAHQAAKALGLDLHIVEPKTAEFIATIDELSYTQEEPFGSGSMFMGWHVFQRARALGCPVMLNGQGGDEILLGYERYFAAHLSTMPWFKKPHEVWAVTRHSNLTVLQLLQYIIYFRFARMRIERLKSRSLVRRALQRKADFETVRASARSFRNIGDMQHLEISSIQLPHLLRYEDRNSMRHSIETRLPFLDYRLVEFCLGLPMEVKMRNGWSKYVLRVAMSDLLPSGIAWRRTKLGFEAPMRSWLTAADGLMREAVRTSPMLREVTDHSSLLERFERLPWLERWKYFNLATWARVYGVNW
jgi:asparagine synthase (glutamine-hydrolysing)